nr:triphosphoribosyl-dephospho-CoA synthase MdcB [Beijerinckia sp. L45]
MIGARATGALMLELATWPKPGLVSHVDTGSHSDMDAAMLTASAEALRPFFVELAAAGQQRCAMNDLRRIGLRAEVAMLEATQGVNTHRGAIFGLGLLCAAAGATTTLTAVGPLVAASNLGRTVAQVWGDEIRLGPIPLFSHGSAVLRQHGAGGARAEAGSGFPSVYGIGLPSLRIGRLLAGADADAPAVHACFALIAAVRDTNLLHRGGEDGASFAAAAARAFLSEGGVGTPDWRERAIAVHAAFVAGNLSPGGCADLLAMTLFVDALDTGTDLT